MCTENYGSISNQWYSKQCFIQTFWQGGGGGGGIMVHAINKGGGAMYRVGV